MHATSPASTVLGALASAPGRPLLTLDKDLHGSRQTVQVREREIGPKPGMWETSGWGSVGWPATGNDTERGSGGTNTSCPPVLTHAKPAISQSTNRSTKCDVLYDLRVLRQPPRTCKSLKSLSGSDSHGGSHRFESCSAHQRYLVTAQPLTSGCCLWQSTSQPHAGPRVIIA